MEDIDKKISDITKVDTIFAQKGKPFTIPFAHHTRFMSKINMAFQYYSKFLRMKKSKRAGDQPYIFNKRLKDLLGCFESLVKLTIKAIGDKAGKDNLFFYTADSKSEQHKRCFYLLKRFLRTAWNILVLMNKTFEFR